MQPGRFGFLFSVAVFAVFGNVTASAQEIKTVFIIAMENHNWTQPNNKFSGGAQQIYQNPNAPFINSLVNGSAFAVINGATVHISAHVAYATAYHNVLSTPDGNNPHVHPSEPNLIWAEAGTNLGVASDNDPYSADGPTVQNTNVHFSQLLTQAGISWRSYQEDIDLGLDSRGEITNIPLPQSRWTVPLVSIAGSFADGYFNEYNGSRQYDYAAKHNPMVLFADTNGGYDSSVNNPLATHYAPLQQLRIDLADDTVAAYNWITPNQNNDMHSPLNEGYKGLTGDDAAIRQGDDFLSLIIPMIMSSRAYQDHGAIIIWWDESEADDVTGGNPDDFDHTIGEIVISPRAHRNVNGLPYASPLNYTHSSDLRTFQEIFQVGPFLGDAADAHDLADLFQRGSILAEPCIQIQVPQRFRWNELHQHAYRIEIDDTQTCHPDLRPPKPPSPILLRFP